MLKRVLQICFCEYHLISPRIKELILQDLFTACLLAQALTRFQQLIKKACQLLVFIMFISLYSFVEHYEFHSRDTDMVNNDYGI